MVAATISPISRGVHAAQQRRRSTPRTVRPARRRRRKTFPRPDPAAAPASAPPPRLGGRFGYTVIPTSASHWRCRRRLSALTGGVHPLRGRRPQLDQQLIDPVWVAQAGGLDLSQRRRRAVPGVDGRFRLPRPKPCSPVSALRSGRMMPNTTKRRSSRCSRGISPARRNDDLPLPEGPSTTNSDFRPKTVPAGETAWRATHPSPARSRRHGRRTHRRRCPRTAPSPDTAPASDPRGAARRNSPARPRCLRSPFCS